MPSSIATGRSLATPNTAWFTWLVQPAAIVSIATIAAARMLLLAGEQVLGDHHALDLRGALVDLEQLGVAHQLLPRVLLGVAVPAEDLHRVGAHPHRRVG